MRSRLVDISFATFARAIAAAALVWVWWHLWRWVLVFVLAACLAVALDPLVRWLQRRGLSRAVAASLIGLVLVILLIGFIGGSGASIAAETQLIGERLRQLHATLLDRLPSDLRDTGASVMPSAQSVANAARLVATAMGDVAVALVVTIYLLIDGRRTYKWLVAFAPPAKRRRVDETAAAAREVVAAYVRGNLITSALTAVITWIALVALGVPAAFVLALVSGVFDFVPVIGFILSAVPATLLAFTVSPSVAAAVAAFFVLYNIVENYYIQPKVYGREMRLSDVAVIAAFLVGAELGGVLGAIVALPLAALYPTVERVWFNQPASDDTADEHRRIEAQPEH